MRTQKEIKERLDLVRKRQHEADLVIDEMMKEAEVELADSFYYRGLCKEIDMLEWVLKIDEVPFL